MGTIEGRGHITHPERLPRLRAENPPLAPKKVPTFPSFGIESQPDTRTPAKPEAAKPVVPPVVVPEAPVNGQVSTPVSVDQGVSAYDPQARLAQIDRELPASIIPIGFIDDELHLFGRKKDLSIVDTYFKRPGLVAVDVAVVKHPDGSETRYIDRPEVEKRFGIGLLAKKTEPGVYKEEYVRDDSGKLKLKERERVGERVGVELVIDPNNPQGEPREFFYVTTEKSNKLNFEKTEIINELNLKKTELEKRAEIEEVLRIRLGDVSYVPTEKEAKGYLKQKENIKKSLNLAKESLWERSKYSLEIFSASVLGSWFFWGVPVPAFINKGAVATAIAPFVYDGISRSNGGPSSLSKESLRLVMGLAAAFELYSLIPLGIAAGLPILPVAGAAAALITAGIAAKRFIDFRRFKKNHPELKDTVAYKKQWRDLARQEKEESLRDKNRAKFIQQHKQNFDELRKLNPHASEKTLVYAIDNLQKLNQMIHSQSVDARYLQKVLGAQGKAAIPGLIFYGGLILADNMLFHIPTVLGIAGTVAVGVAASLGNSIIATTARHRNLMGVKRQIRQEHPELLA